MTLAEATHNQVSGITAGHPACVMCGHVHRVTDYMPPNTHVTYDTACGCGCLVNAPAYDYGDRGWFSREDLNAATPQVCKKHGWPLL